MSSLNSTLLLAKRAQYRLRRNAGLDTAEKSKAYKTFRSRVKQVLMAQVDQVIDNDELLDQLTFLLGKETDRNLMAFLRGKFIDFGSMFAQLFGDQALEDFYTWAGEEGGQSALDRMGIQVDFKLTNDQVNEYLANARNLLIRSVDDTTREQIARVIEEGRNGFLSRQEIKELLRQRFEELTDARAEAIARTELSNAFNQVEYEAMRRNDVKRVRWVTVVDERVCEICEPLHNVEVPLGANFPGIGQNRPPAHVNCRCFMEEVISGVTIRSNIVLWSGE